MIRTLKYFTIAGSLLLITAIYLPGCVQPDSVESPQVENNPVITSMTADPNPVRVGNITTITVIASDPLNSPLSYQWFTTLGDISGSGSQVQYSASYCCAGSVKVTVVVRNNHGGSATQSIFVNVTQ